MRIEKTVPTAPTAIECPRASLNCDEEVKRIVVISFPLIFTSIAAKGKITVTNNAMIISIFIPVTRLIATLRPAYI
jgi:hypothetical protein